MWNGSIESDLSGKHHVFYILYVNIYIHAHTLFLENNGSFWSISVYCENSTYKNIFEWILLTSMKLSWWMRDMTLLLNNLCICLWKLIFLMIIVFSKNYPWMFEKQNNLKEINAKGPLYILKPSGLKKSNHKCKLNLQHNTVKWLVLERKNKIK